MLELDGLKGGKWRAGTKGPKLPLDATMARDLVSIAPPRAVVENTGDGRGTFSSMHYFDHKHREH